MCHAHNCYWLLFGVTLVRLVLELLVPTEYQLYFYRSHFNMLLRWFFIFMCTFDFQVNPKVCNVKECSYILQVISDVL